MNNLTFNKKARNYQRTSEPTIIFRELVKIGNNKRFQGNINAAGVELIKGLFDGYYSLKVEFSDEHTFVGLKPVSGGAQCQSVMAVTSLFREVPLVTGKHYSLEINGDYVVFNSSQYGVSNE